MLNYAPSQFPTPKIHFSLGKLLKRNSLFNQCTCACLTNRFYAVFSVSDLNAVENGFAICNIIQLNGILKDKQAQFSLCFALFTIHIRSGEKQRHQKTNNMSQTNDAVGCFSETGMYGNDIGDKCEWTKSKPMSFTEQLEKWNKVRQSLYSQNGWCSTNVNQISKWDVGDMGAMSNNSASHMQQHSHETGTNIWNANLSHQPQQQPIHMNQPCPLVPDSSTSAINPTSPQPTPTQMADWKSTGAIPKMFHLRNMNCLSVNANIEFPYGSSSQTPQLNANVFHDCDTLENATNTTTTVASATTDAITDDKDDVNVALRLQLDTMNLGTEFCDNITTNRTPNLNQISNNLCQIPKQYQVDCVPRAFS